MLKEIVHFTETALADDTFRKLGVTPKEGLHIVLSMEQSDEQTRIAEKATYAYYSRKTKELSPLLLKCTEWWKASTMLGAVDTYKVFDVPAKAIHTVSPFCMGLKKTNLEGGEQYAENQLKGKSQVYDRINAYFSKAAMLLDSDEDKIIADAFRLALSDKSRLNRWLNDSVLFEDVKDGEYVIFYLDLPVSKYEGASQKYLKEKLFNTGDYNIPDEAEPELLHGTSNWFNSFPTKKPYLMHQSATFDIAGRISSREAQLLQEFSDMSRRKLFPNPLPLFVAKDEITKAAFKIFKEDAVSGNETRKGYLEIIEELWKDYKNELGNYYLLFMVKGEIRDFDFVSRFDFYLSPDGAPWNTEDLFGTGAMQLETVKDLLTQVLPPLFNNALVVRRKEKDWIFHWFDEMDAAYCKTHNACLMAMKYRKAFYDYIYKSQRQSVTGEAILDILMTGIRDDIRLDDYKNGQHTEGYNIRQKLNLLFNLHQYFSNKPNSRFMANNITQLRTHIDEVAKGSAHIETDEQFAFAAGQVIDRIHRESMTGDESFRYLEPFLAQHNAEQLKVSIGNFFKRYKHGVFATRFKNVISEVLSYPAEENMRRLQPLLLAGVFSKNLLFAEKKEDLQQTETN